MAKYKARTVEGPDLSKFGLAAEQIGARLPTSHDASPTMAGARSDELFRDHELDGEQPWWKSNFFLSSPVLFGAWDGVYTSCVIHLFGVITFLRTGWMVGNAGVLAAVLIVVLSVFISTVAVSAGIGISDRCRRAGGNVHCLLSHVLGSRLGGSISIVYSFGQAVSCALHVMGFAETIAALLRYDDPWFERSVGVALVLLLLVINIAGVKWVVRLQFMLLLILFFAALDFAVGICIQRDPSHGVLGFSIQNLERNMEPNYEAKVNLFTVFGVFFPAVTGVFSGVNMTGDLYNPRKSIPLGTYAAIGTAFFLYLLFVIGLGATVDRAHLTNDYLIATKVAAVGYFLLGGLYVSSLSSCLGAIYATPRIIQNMASERILPGSKYLSKGQGPNKVPVVALLLFAVVTFAFIMIQKINVLATIVTIPFLMTYASVEYAYFSLAMSFDIIQKRENRFGASSSAVHKGTKDYGAFRSEIDMLFPERLESRGPDSSRRASSSSSEPTESVKTSPITSPDEHSSIRSVVDRDLDDESGGTSAPPSRDPLAAMKHDEIYAKSGFWYSVLSNRWVAVASALLKIAIMFLVHWGYALSALAAVVFFWFYIGQINPGVNPGANQFHLARWIKGLFLCCFGKQSSEYQQIIVPSSNPTLEVTASQITAEGTDFASRERYHQATTAPIKTINP